MPTNVAARVVARIIERQAKAIPLDNQEIERLAQQILRELPVHLKFRPGDAQGPLWQARGFHPDRWGYTLEETFKTTNVRGHPVAVKVQVGAKQSTQPGRDYITSGGARGYYHSDGKGFKLFTTLLVFFNSERSPQELLDNRRGPVYKELLSVLRHEVTHLKDLLEHSKKDMNIPEVYYNDPGEVRAFTRQIVDEAIEFAHDVGKDDPFFLYLDTKFIERALVKSPTWDRISPVLTEKNERIIRKSVARALKDEWPELQRLYPMDAD